MYINNVLIEEIKTLCAVSIRERELIIEQQRCQIEKLICTVNTLMNEVTRLRGYNGEISVHAAEIHAKIMENVETESEISHSSASSTSTIINHTVSHTVNHTVNNANNHTGNSSNSNNSNNANSSANSSANISVTPMVAKYHKFIFGTGDSLTESQFVSAAFESIHGRRANIRSWNAHARETIIGEYLAEIMRADPRVYRYGKRIMRISIKK